MPSNPPASPDHKRAELRRAALEYHEFPTPGKIAIAPTKQLVNQYLLPPVRGHSPRRSLG
jgi:malate dehydrogenase (oxaloacetate-decarboxylating)(NADP+)